MNDTPLPRLVCVSKAICSDRTATLLYVRSKDLDLVNESTGHLEIKRMDMYGKPVFHNKYLPYFEREDPVIIGLDNTSKYWMVFEDEAEAAIYKLTHL